MGEMSVGGTKLVSPFRDTMGFVDSDTSELPLSIDNTENAAKRLSQDKLRSNVE